MLFSLTSQVMIESRPFRWAKVQRFLSADQAHELRRSFPHDLPVSQRQGGSDKTYFVASTKLLRADGKRQAPSAFWNSLIESACERDYRSFLSSIAEKDISDSFVEIEINSYRSCGFMSAHTDRPPKVLTHIIYLNSIWPEHWGGELEILSSPESPPFQKVTPVWPNSVVLLRSDASWHSVRSVSPQATDPRLTIQITFWADVPPASKPGRSILEARHGGDPA
jgi:SM-20-related protein